MSNSLLPLLASDEEGISKYLEFKVLAGDGDKLGEYLLIPAVRSFLDRLQHKITGLNQSQVAQLLASFASYFMADSLLEENPDDEFARTLKEMSRHAVMKFVFAGRSRQMAPRKNAQLSRSDKSNPGGELVEVRDIPKSAKEVAKSLEIGESGSGQSEKKEFSMGLTSLG